MKYKPTDDELDLYLSVLSDNQSVRVPNLKRLSSPVRKIRSTGPPQHLQKWVIRGAMVTQGHYISRESQTTRSVWSRAYVCLCLCACLSLAAFPHYCADPDVTWRNGREFPLVVHCWADLQSVHMFCFYDNIARTRNVSECLYSLYMPG